MDAFKNLVRKAVAQALGVFVLAVLVSGCASRPGPDALTPVALPPDAKLLKILVATNRERQTPDANIFTSNKAQALNFAEFTIAVPPDHRRGHLELAGAGHDGFVVVEQNVISGGEFLNRAGAQTRGKRGDVTVFVHGYNNNFQEALFRFAQVVADSGMDGTHILFSWPSRAEITGYVADRDAVIYSRDYFAALLTQLAQDRRVGRIRVAAHSMGGWLTVETLRELRLVGRDDVIRRTDVVLAAPDIDVEVFAQQLKVIGPLSPPMKILVSKDDGALRASRFIASSIGRVGALDVEDPRVRAAVLREKVQVIDISGLSSPDRLGHDRFVYLAALYPRLSRQPPIANAGVFLLDAAGTVVQAPLRSGIMPSGPD